ncbi:MAG: hypothetical protein EYC68_11700 [Chloroflexota bacterium]|nr:MAG: hypothetical protein EYC68_11700 [Chloroflexota bacterium]
MLPELRKLGVNAGQKILVHRAPKAFTQELRDQAPPETLISTRYTKRAQYDLIFHFAAADENLDALFELMQHALKLRGALWVVMPKQKHAKQRGYLYDWNSMIARALKTTLVDNKTLTFSPEEYGTRFVIRKEFRETGK